MPNYEDCEKLKKYFAKMEKQNEKPKPKPKNTARRNKDGRSKSRTSQWEQIATNLKRNKKTGKFQATFCDKEKREYQNFDTLEEAKAALAEYAHKKSTGRGYKITKETFTEYAAAFIERSTHLELTTKDGYRSILKRIQQELIGALKISKIIALDIENYINKLRASKELSNATINKHRDFISTVFDDAIKNGFLWVNPALAVRRLKKEPFRGTALTVSQVRTLTETLEREKGNQNIKVAVYLGLFAGLRRGEVFGLKWEHVNFTDNTIYICNARVDINGKGATDKAPKSKEGYRTVGINPLLISTLKEVYELQINRFKKPCVYVLSTETGEPYRYYSTIERQFKRALKVAELPNIRYHDLRDTYGTLMSNAGVNMALIANQMGHSSTATTLKYYIQQNKDNARAAANTMFAFVLQEEKTPLPTK